MPGDIKLNGAKIQNGWRKVLFAQIFDSAEFLDLTGDG